MRQMVQPAKGQEPSMEEILASIRRIIADDDSAKTQPPKPADGVVQQPAASSPRPAPPPRAMTPPPPIEPMISPSAALAAAKERADFPKPASFAPESEHEPETGAEMSPDILDLTERMAAERGGFRTIDAELDLIFEETPPGPPEQPTQMMAEAPAPVEPPLADPPAGRAPARAEQSLMSAATSAAVDSAFNTLAQTVLVQNGRTLEDLVREMLRPMLKTWLDDNLPGMVERLVRAEIERVSRGRP
jgi:cell pole-organizing protein PopZ